MFRSIEFRSRNRLHFFGAKSGRSQSAANVLFTFKCSFKFVHFLITINHSICFILVTY